MSNVRNFGASGDGKQDDLPAIQHAIDQGDGVLEFPRGDYLITKPIEIDVTRQGRTSITGNLGTAKIIMQGSGPAIRIIGNHAGTADPSTVKPEVWSSQRMPTIEGIEIEGRHAEADGIELTGTVQAMIRSVGLHRLRHGVHLVQRNRNVIIEGCQIYHNTGAGVFMEDVNLHQIIVIGNHISYNRLGGIRIERSEVRNLQITGNDIEYNTNRTHKIKDEPTAEIYIDLTADNATVNEVTIGSNTIQAQPSPNGANIRIIEDRKGEGRPPGLFAITGNVIGSQTNNVHLTGCYGITLTGNNIYSSAEYNVLLEGCQQIVMGSNQMRRHTPQFDTGVRIQDSKDCIISGCHILDETESGGDKSISLMELVNSERITINSCHMLTKARHCLSVENCRDVLVSASTLVNRFDKFGKAVIRWTGQGQGNSLHGCQIRPDVSEAVQLAATAGVKQS